ncbi:MAG: hypothetical protein K8E66_13700 [Phycisphaerales bacterium]|nr:hypothetical protein [Phycisphaerales bacterium]
MISRTRARTVRLASQAAAGVLVVGAALLAVVGAPFLSTTGVEPVSHERVIEKARDLAAQFAASKPQARDDTELPPDYEAIEYSLSMVSNAPQPKGEEESPPPPTQDENNDVVREGRTRFLGTIAIGERMLALVSAGGGQRILGPGDRATLAITPGEEGDPPEVEVSRVTARAVWLTENGVEYRVERAARTGFAVSQGATPTSVPSEMRPANVDDMDAAVASADKPLNPDDYRRDDGSIDYESLRQAARARARARQELRQQQRDENGEN